MNWFRAFLVAVPSLAYASAVFAADGPPSSLPPDYAVNLCDAVSGQILETDPSHRTVYTYQTQIYAGAGVNENSDDPEVIKRKIQVFWNANWRELRCSNINFSITNGNILKQAVERNSRNFVNDMVRKWQVDVNVVDPIDGKTLMDYVIEQREVNLGTNLGSVLQYYYIMLSQHGAKRAREM